MMPIVQQYNNQYNDADSTNNITTKILILMAQQFYNQYNDTDSTTIKQPIS